METDRRRPTPEQARAALTAVEQIRATGAALSATPWPTWFFVALTLYIGVLPICVGGAVADGEWLLPRMVWMGVAVTVIAVQGALQAVATRAWRARTGVALRLDVLPKRAIVPIAVGLPVLMVGAPIVFRATGRPAWLIAASLIGAAVSVGCHLAFVRLHRKPAQAPEGAV
ncbi:hypothetical protein [Streptomyces abyssomicinicus]|uniref:hypothetical protein n=1 Tax=Streptomyces abyssomicinicus TaxID=574929 RepID=UPI0013DF42EE|nr:hypothetical protein [Streptomyces abyssomicinicus]